MGGGGGGGGGDGGVCGGGGGGGGSGGDYNNTVMLVMVMKGAIVTMTRWRCVASIIVFIDCGRGVPCSPTLRHYRSIKRERLLGVYLHKVRSPSVRSDEPEVGIVVVGGAEVVVVEREGLARVPAKLG